jgi:hypothetical protein
LTFKQEFAIFKTVFEKSVVKESNSIGETRRVLANFNNELMSRALVCVRLFIFFRFGLQADALSIEWINLEEVFLR